MPGHVIHLAIADKIIETLPNNNFKNSALFYAGNIAPDAIHMREGYIREYKRHTHMMDNISNSSFLKSENQIIFHQRVTDFITKYYRQDDECADLYKGYVSHLLADEFFRLSSVNSTQNKPSDNASYDDIVREIDRIGKFIAKNYLFKNNIIEKLEQVTDYGIDEYITKEELNKSKDYVLRMSFKNSEKIVSPAHFNLEDTINSVNTATLNIIERLSNGIDFPIMFLIK